ncbi:MAG: SURF1 family protein [Pseudomonadales bacterium]|nr:SURF1 family protein [Pseudomonadales bacterium]
MKHFAPGWRMTLFVVILLPTVLTLGAWQLSRGAEKRALESDYLDRLTSLPVRAAEFDPNVRFQRVKLSGELQPQVFLVDNQILNGKTGYWVLQLFIETQGRRFIVNRGFLAAQARRDQLPEVPLLPGRVELLGVAWPYTGLIPVLDDDPWPDTWPKRVQRLDIKRMAQVLSAEPVEVRLEPGQSGVLQAAPFAQVLSDAKHRGYAATWFGLAITLLIGYVFLGIRNARENDN